MPTTKKPSLSSLHKKAWKEFSYYIRLRDCLNTTGTPEHGRCFTCDQVKPFGLLDAGHFISRGSKSILYHERNVHAQCKACNGFREGNKEEYYPRMVERYGQEFVDFLKMQKNELSDFKIYQLEELILVYRQKIKELKKGIA